MRSLPPCGRRRDLRLPAQVPAGGQPVWRQTQIPAATAVRRRGRGRGTGTTRRPAEDGPQRGRGPRSRGGAGHRDPRLRRRTGWCRSAPSGDPAGGIVTARYACVAGVGAALPDRVVTNQDLERVIDTSDEWIRRRTGIRARRFAGLGETAASLAADAAAAALDASGVAPAAIDVTIVATVTGDQPMPSTASLVQQRLEISGAAFDLQAACAGFIYALDVASARIQAGMDDTALVIGTEVLSRFLDMSDRTT